MRLIRVQPFSPWAPLGCNVHSPRISLRGEIMMKTCVRVQESKIPVPEPNEARTALSPDTLPPNHRSSIATPFYCKVDIWTANYRRESSVTEALKLTDQYKYFLSKPYIRRFPSKLSDFICTMWVCYSVDHDCLMPLCEYMSKIDRITWYRRSENARHHFPHLPRCDYDIYNKACL